MSAQYTAKSLADIAASFDHHAWQATAFSDRLHKTQRDKLLAERESQTWKRAAQILRETKLEPLAAIREIMSRVCANSDPDAMGDALTEIERILGDT